MEAMSETYCPICHRQSALEQGDGADRCEHCDSTLLLRGRWWLGEMLGHGSSGYTWKGIDAQNGAVVAIKELSFRRLTDLKQLELFEREAEALASIDHDAVPNFVDHFIIEEDRFVSAYLVQEFIDGGVLSTSARTDEEEVLQFLEQMARLFEHLHSRRPPIVHRDIKPSNVMRRQNGRYVLIDFGSIRANTQESAGGSTVAGTLGYMAPEQLVGRADVASDYYGLGATALALLAGGDAHRLIEHHRPGAWVSQVTLSDEMAGLLQQLLKPDIDERLKTPAALRREIENVREPRPPRVRRPRVRRPRVRHPQEMDEPVARIESVDTTGKFEAIQQRLGRFLQPRNGSDHWMVHLFAGCGISAVIVFSYLWWAPWLLREIWTLLAYSSGTVIGGLLILLVPTFGSFMVLGGVPFIIAREMLPRRYVNWLIIPLCSLFTVLLMGWMVVGFSHSVEDLYVIQKGEETRFVVQTKCRFKVIEESRRYVGYHAHYSGCHLEVVDGRFLRTEAEDGLAYLDAWSGEVLFDLSRELAGDGDFRILSSEDRKVEVELQDGWTREFTVELSEGPGEAELFEPLSVESRPLSEEEMGSNQLHRPVVLIPAECGACPDCGPVISHSTTAFGEGRQMVSRLDRDGRPMWTVHPSDDYFSAESAYDVDGQCWLYIPRTLGVSEVVRLDQKTGALSRVWRF